MTHVPCSRYETVRVVIVVIGRVKCSEENRAELIAAFERMQEASRLEDGCLRYGFYAAVEDPNSTTSFPHG